MKGNQDIEQGDLLIDKKTKEKNQEPNIIEEERKKVKWIKESGQCGKKGKREGERKRKREKHKEERKKRIDTGECRKSWWLKKNGGKEKNNCLSLFLYFSFKKNREKLLWEDS